MPKYILKLTNNDKDFYMEWSTIVDAPVTNGMTLDEFKRHYEKMYGTDGMKDLPERLSRVEKTGTSSMLDYADELIKGNRAGKNESELTKEEIIKEYCL